mgnify:CR=1 FL=1
MTEQKGWVAGAGPHHEKTEKQRKLAEFSGSKSGKVVVGAKSSDVKLSMVQEGTKNVKMKIVNN